MSSRNLSAAQLSGLVKAGDIVIPGDAELPSFSRSGASAHVDRMFDYMHDSDRDGLKLLFSIFNVLPAFLLRGILKLSEKDKALPGPLGAAARMINVGVKGVVMTLYYSDTDQVGINQAIGWDAKCDELDLPEGVEEVAAKEAPQALAAAASSEAERATMLARAGAAALSRLSVKERSAYVASLRDIVLRRREQIIDRIQADTAKSRSDALMSEIYGVLEALHWLEKRAPKLLADRKQYTPLSMLGKSSWTWYEPLGTVLIISPWNYPFIQALIPIASALLAGNTVIYKPSEHTPLEGLIEELLAEAQVPPNWVRIVYGDGSTGAQCVAARPDKVFFTGSTRTGRKIAAQASELLVPVELELGGKDPMIVFADADVQRAAAGALWGALTNTGQSCTSVERLYVERPIYDAFKSELTRQAERIVQAVDSDGSADIGEMTTGFQVEIVARHLEDARAKGAAVLCGEQWDGKSKAIPPIVLDRVSDDMLLAVEESFGPLIPLMPFDGEEEVIARANDSEYGLTASVWSKDLERARRVARRLACGGVSINNVMLTEGNPALPFGGVKNSGFGRHKGEHGLHGFCNIKSVLIDKDSNKIEANWYPYTTEKYRLFSDLLTHLFGRRRSALIKFAATGMKLEKYSDKAGKRGREQ